MDSKIEQILKSNRIEQILDIKNFKEEFTLLIKEIHPDICKHPKATEATSKLNEFRKYYEEGKEYRDESGLFRTNGYFSLYEGNRDLLERSLSNYQTLMSFKDEASKNFHKYLPSSIQFEGLGHGDKLRVNFSQRAIPLTDLKLPQVHVNWILSRMLEFSAWLEKIGFSHGGINPESIFIIPENHGIQVATFYMMTPLGKKPSGISGKYQDWYPADLFTLKKALSYTDMELSKRTSVSLLGDKSGNGVILKRNPDVNKEVLNFLIAHHNNPGLAWHEYRKILEDNFEKKFYNLDL